MPKQSLRFLFFLLIGLAAGAAHASDTDSQIDLLLAQSGLTDQVQQIPESLKAGMMQAQQMGDPLPDSTFQAMMHSADRSIVADDILDEVHGALARSLTEQDINNLLAWYQSDLGQEITEAEKSSSSPAAYGEMMNQAKSLYGDSRRVKFAQRLDKLFGASEMVMDLQQYTGVAVFSALMLHEQPGADVDIGAFKQQISTQIEASRSMVEQGIVLSFLYSYQDIDMDKLDEYEDFLNQPSTVKFNETVIESMNRALETGISDFAKDLARLLESNLQQS